MLSVPLKGYKAPSQRDSNPRPLVMSQALYHLAIERLLLTPLDNAPFTVYS